MQYSQCEVALRIIKERKRAGFSQAKLAELLHVNRNTIAAWEKAGKGGRIPPLDDMLKMCSLFDCELEYLLGRLKCKTREATDIQQETGLSEGAIDALRRFKERYSDVMSAVFISSCFPAVLRGISKYIARAREVSYIMLDEKYDAPFPLLDASESAWADYKEGQCIKAEAERLRDIAISRLYHTGISFASLVESLVDTLVNNGDDDNGQH